MVCGHEGEATLNEAQTRMRRASKTSHLPCDVGKAVPQPMKFRDARVNLKA
jgi:hypothetical protein